MTRAERRAATSLEASPPPSFGEEGGRLSYSTYLAVPELLSLQRPESRPPAHDELLFIVIHQTYELWFKELLFELTSARDLIVGDELYGALHLLDRVHRIERVMIEQIPILESMSPQDFLEFRRHLAPASGFQSAQFREIEFLSGLKDRALLSRLETSPAERAALERRLDEPTLWEAFCGLLERRGLPMPSDDDEVRRRSLIALATGRVAYATEISVSEALLTHDQSFAHWRVRHVLMVERQIGSKSGTGGSTGASYLRTTLDKRFYPELWALRSWLG
jgi:tryptophan 2,3-dioxygenase